jgi:hypothetical protein
MTYGPHGQMRGRQKDFVDFQVFLAIKRNNGCNLYELLQICKKEYPSWVWTYGRVWTSVRRLVQKGKVYSIDSFVQGRACRKIFLRSQKRSDLLSRILGLFGLFETLWPRLHIGTYSGLSGRNQRAAAL